MADAEPSRLLHFIATASTSAGMGVLGVFLGGELFYAAGLSGDDMLSIIGFPMSLMFALFGIKLGRVLLKIKSPWWRVSALLLAIA